MNEHNILLEKIDWSEVRKLSNDFVKKCIERKESKCLSCEWFWKTQPDKEKKCYRGGSNGGLIHYCTGYKIRGESPMTERYIERLTKWEGRDPDGTPRAVLAKRDGQFASILQEALRKLAKYEDEEEKDDS